MIQCTEPLWFLAVLNSAAIATVLVCNTWLFCAVVLPLWRVAFALAKGDELDGVIADHLKRGGVR